MPKTRNKLPYCCMPYNGSTLYCPVLLEISREIIIMLYDNRVVNI